MSVQVEHDGTEWPEVQENCCMCRTPTRYWYGSGQSNVALCPSCAEVCDTSILPNKKEWIAFERSQRKSF